jgi:hypothetical protein
MNPQEIRPYVGAGALWRQIQAGGPDASAPWCGWPSGRTVSCGPADGGIARDLSMPKDARKDTTVRFADGATGFKVISIQQMGSKLGFGMALYANHQREYLVRHGLTMEQRRAVALAIFMEVSLGFERMQGRFPYGLVSGDSSFSQEDLVSNVIGFYIAVGAVTKAQVLQAAHPVPKAAALEMWDRDGPVGTHKNKQFVPMLSPNTSYSDTHACRDACLNQPGVPPAFLSNIVPAAKGGLFIDFPKP